jgi:hypothetical protein
VKFFANSTDNPVDAKVVLRGKIRFWALNVDVSSFLISHFLAIFIP